MKATKENILKSFLKAGSNKTESLAKIEKYYDDVMRLFAGQNLTANQARDIIWDFALSDC